MRFCIPNNTKCYGGVSDTNTNSTKYTLETPNNPKYKFFWLFGTPNCHALVTSTHASASQGLLYSGDFAFHFIGNFLPKFCHVDNSFCIQNTKSKAEINEETMQEFYVLPLH